uniref:Beta-defensin n=1 Tax=Equus asinus asinus TaxID=83772 RepID=A0A8C4MDZ2_EQUAS
MRSLLSVLVILVLLSYVPPGKMEFPSIYSTCWRLKGVCKRTCAKKEVYHILCDTATLCCISAKDLPPLVSRSSF